MSWLNISLLLVASISCQDLNFNWSHSIIKHFGLAIHVSYQEQWIHSLPLKCLAFIHMRMIKSFSSSAHIIGIAFQFGMFRMSLKKYVMACGKLHSFWKMMLISPTRSCSALWKFIMNRRIQQKDLIASMSILLFLRRHKNLAQIGHNGPHGVHAKVISL